MVHGRTFGHDRTFGPAGRGLANPGAQLAVPSAVADSMIALRLRLATLRGKVRMPSRIWLRRGVDTLRSGLTSCLGVAQLRDLQRITFALFDWNPGHFDKDATTVLSWCDAHIPAPPRLPVLLLRLQGQYDQLCDLRVLEWADLITRLSPDLPEVVVRDWLSLLVDESVEDGAVAAEWFSYLAAGGAVEAVALGVAVGDVEFLEAISQCLLHCPQPALYQPAVPRHAGVREDPPVARDKDKTKIKDAEHETDAIAPNEAAAPESPDSGVAASSTDFSRERELFQADNERARAEGPGAGIAGAVLVPTPTVQTQLKLSGCAQTSTARLAAEPVKQELLEALESGDSGTLETDPFGSEEASPRKPVFRGDAVGDKGHRQRWPTEQVRKTRESRLEKSAVMPAPLRVRRAQGRISQGEGETPSAARAGVGVPVSIILVCALVLAGIGVPLWWFYPGAGDFVDQHELSSERPPAPIVASPEPVVPKNERSEIKPAVVAPPAQESANEADSPAFPQSGVASSSLNFREVFLLIACCFIALVDLYMFTHWNDGDHQEQPTSANTKNLGLQDR